MDIMSAACDVHLLLSRCRNGVCMQAFHSSTFWWMQEKRLPINSAASSQNHLFLLAFMLQAYSHCACLRQSCRPRFLFPQGLWQNKAARKCSFQVLEQSGKLHARCVSLGCIRGHQRLAACTNSPLTEGRDCAISKPLFSMQQLALAHTVDYLPVHSLCGKNCKSKALPSPFDLDDGPSVKQEASLNR